MLLLTGPTLLGAVACAYVAHNAFRRYETTSVLIHVSLLTIPPMCTILYTAPQSFTASLAVFPTYLVSLAAFTILYRLSPLHPLARYPGPLSCKATKLRYAILSLSGRQHEFIHELHERYGDVVRIGPNELSIRDASAITTLLGASGVPKGPHLWARMLDHKALMMIALQDTALHLQRRRPWARAFTSTAVRGYEELVSKRVKQLIGELEKQKGRVDLNEWFKCFAFDVMSDMVFGGDSDLLGGTNKSTWWKTQEAANAPGTFFSHLPWLGAYLRPLPPFSGPINAHLTNCRQRTLKRLQHDSETRDLFYYLNNDDIDAPAPPLEQLADDGILAMGAGSDTTASALTSLFFCLLAYPDVCVRLQGEIDKFYPRGADVLNPEHYREMPYLNAVINETLRLFPPVPGGTQRQVPRDGPAVVVNSIHLPPGTSFWMHVHSIHRDPRNFYPHTDTFWPDRWLLSSTSTSSEVSAPPEGFTHAEHAFVPFSHGPMNCVGRAFALQEMRAVVCALVRRFDFGRWELRFEDGETARGEGERAVRAYERGYKDYFVTERPAVEVELRARENDGNM